MFVHFFLDNFMKVTIMQTNSIRDLDIFCRLLQLHTIILFSVKSFASEKRHTYLCPGRREFVELPEISAPDYVVSMAWCGDSLCLGIRREYVIVNTASGVVTDVFQCGPMAPPLVLPLANGEVLLGKVCIHLHSLASYILLSS